MALKKSFYDWAFPKKKKKNHSDSEVIYYLEVLPINKQSAIPTRLQFLKTK